MLEPPPWAGLGTGAGCGAGGVEGAGTLGTLGPPGGAIGPSVLGAAGRSLAQPTSLFWGLHPDAVNETTS